MMGRDRATKVCIAVQQAACAQIHPRTQKQRIPPSGPAVRAHLGLLKLGPQALHLSVLARQPLLQGERQGWLWLARCSQQPVAAHNPKARQCTTNGQGQEGSQRRCSCPQPQNPDTCARLPTTSSPSQLPHPPTHLHLVYNATPAHPPTAPTHHFTLAQPRPPAAPPRCGRRPPCSSPGPAAAAAPPAAPPGAARPGTAPAPPPAACARCQAWPVERVMWVGWVGWGWLCCVGLGWGELRVSLCQQLAPAVKLGPRTG